ncbi:subtilisin-like protein [Myriangium duriaei CBS 260.36]|uniref:Subtilisin-like protein n=1 Tax=Myriangium duriaei CBS 260.36 TaxID=1168546 RepID=A0A9P4ISH9_9PEZI|nr:subtilisin-like protein [Myriangium duriaei CBS 260.36]
MDANSPIRNDIFRGLSHNYTIGNFKGYSGRFDRSTIAQLKTHDEVAAIDPDHIVTSSIIDACCRRGSKPVTQNNASYALHQISHREPAGTDYIYKSPAGRGTFAYIIDTGIFTKHEEFEKRAKAGFDIDREPAEREVDRIGQGTFAAALVGGKTFGVAKKCSLVSVKVASRHGGLVGLTDVLVGLNFAVKDIVTKKRQSKAVILLGFDSNGDVSAITKALSEAHDKGITIVTAAGHGGATIDKAGKDAGYGFNLAKGAIVVAATDMQRKRASFSNWGSKVTIFAPGVDLVSAEIDSPSATKARSGTGISAAYIAGLILYLKSVYKLPDPKSTTAKLLELATKDVVKDAKESSNLFAYNGGGEK